MPLDQAQDVLPLRVGRRIVVFTQKPQTPRAVVVDQATNGSLESTGFHRPILSDLARRYGSALYHSRSTHGSSKTSTSNTGAWPSSPTATRFSP